MSTQSAPETVLAELEDAAYQRMLDHHRGEWFAIARGKLYHASSRESVVSQLAADGAESGTVLVTRFPFREPFLVL